MEEGAVDLNTKLRKIQNAGNLTLRSMKLSIKWRKMLNWRTLNGDSTVYEIWGHHGVEKYNICAIT
jgi:hypothetical protein